MIRQHHYLKTDTQYFQAAERGEKKYGVKAAGNAGIADALYLRKVGMLIT